MTEELIKKYYSELGLKEWRRLVRDPYHRLEFETTMHFVKKRLPKTGLVLDVGGGPGRYTIELAKLGYDVVLLDLTPELLSIARKQISKAGVQDRVKQVLNGSVDDLSMFEDNNFDIVLCLGGALSHVLERARREKAIDELIRVAKKNALICVSVIGRLAVTIAALVQYPEEIEKIIDVHLKIIDTGDYYGGYGFAPCHFYLPEELKDSFKKRSVKLLERVGLEGLATLHRKETNRLSKRSSTAWKNWQEIHLKTCTHPSVVAISEHFMMTMQKK